jgi:hypothetical protein
VNVIITLGSFTYDIKKKQIPTFSRIFRIKKCWPGYVRNVVSEGTKYSHPLH